MTVYRKELTAEQVQDVAKVLGLTAADNKVWVLAIDKLDGDGVADVLAADDVVWFTGADMERSSWTRYRNGTVQMTFKRKPGR